MTAADVFVLATINKTKHITVLEDVDVVKSLDVQSLVNLTADKAAESDALVNQSNFSNHACTNCDEKVDQLIGSANTNSGVVSVNQAAGNMNNQGNAVAIAVDVVAGGDGTLAPAQTSSGFANAQASADQANGRIRLILFEAILILFPAPNTVDTVNLLFRDAIISASLNGNTGVVQANQSVGNMNNQANALSAAVSLDAGVALSESDLGQFSGNNIVRESDASFGTTPRIGINKTASITGSVNLNSGIVGVNQAAGNMVNQGNIVSAAATLSQ